MNGVALKIRRLKKFRKELEGLELQLLKNNDGTWKIRMRNKFILLHHIPDEMVAQKMLSEIHGLMKKTIGDINQINSCLEERVEQLTLQMFGGNE